MKKVDNSIPFYAKLTGDRKDILINIEKYNAYVKTIVGNEPVPPFSLDLSKDMVAEEKARNPKLAEMIKRLSSLKYGIANEIVEAEVGQRARL